MTGTDWFCQSPCRANCCRLLLAFWMVLLMSSAIALAGGPAIVHSGSLPFRWSSSQPVPFVIDNGPLGALSRDEAAEIVRAAFEEWEAVETSTLRFEDKGYLELDLDATSYRTYFDGYVRGDNPVVFDTDGTILDDLLGKGAGDFVNGFSGPRFLDPDSCTFSSSWIILNGKEVSPERLARIVLHEIGHAIGLDHTQAGRVWADSLDPRDNPLVPIMYPFLVPGGFPELQTDDRSWLSWLYPTEAFLAAYGAIEGTVTRSDGQPVNGAHVVAVRVDNGAEASAFETTSETVSAVSGLLDAEEGSFLIPGLKPGEYLLYVEPLDTRFKGVSSIQLAGQASDFPAEYYNGTEESGTHLDHPGDKRLLTVRSEKRLSGIDFITNDLIAPMIFPARISEDWKAFSDNVFAGSIFNGGEEPGQLEMKIRNQDGVIRHLISRALSPLVQETLLTDKFLENETGHDLLWTVEGSTKVRGFFFAGSQTLDRVEGMGGLLRESRHLFYPSVRSDVEASSLVYLVNSEARAADNILLRLRDSDGTEISTVMISLQSGGYLASPLNQLFELQAPLTDAYLEVESSTPVRGFALTSEKASFDLLAAQPALLTKRFFAPHFVVDRSGTDTEIRILNSSDERVEIEVDLFCGGEESTHPFSIAAGNLLTVSLRGLVEPGDSSLTGHLQINLKGVPRASLIGSITLKGPAGRFKASSPLASEGRYSVLFPHVTQSGPLGVFTGLALLNPSQETARIQVQAFDQEGASTALARFSVAPGSRVVGMLDEAIFFGRHFQQIGGRVEIRSSNPIVISGLFGAASGEYLATLEGQEAVY